METILITGGTGLISTPQVRYFLDNGYRVIVTYRNKDKFNKLSSSKNLFGIYTPELLNDDVVDNIICSLEKLNLFPEYLVNNACDIKWHKMEESGQATRECMLNQYKINVILPYELSFKLANHPKTKLKKIINISSMYGIVPYNPHLYDNPEIETPLQYSVSKAALIHLTKELAIRFRDKNIMVNTISYGGVNGRVDDNFKKRFEELTPLRRMMEPEDTIAPLEFLIKENSQYITGQNIIVDGGRTVW